MTQSPWNRTESNLELIFQRGSLSWPVLREGAPNQRIHFLEMAQGLSPKLIINPILDLYGNLAVIVLPTLFN